MPTWANSLLTAVVSGATMATAQMLQSGGKASWASLGIGAAVGAGIGIINWLRTSPWNPPQATLR